VQFSRIQDLIVGDQIFSTAFAHDEDTILPEHTLNLFESILFSDQIPALRLTP